MSKYNISEMKENFKFLSEDTLTAVIEVLIGKSINDWDSNIKQTLRSSIQMPTLFSIKKDGSMVIELTNAVAILSVNTKAINTIVKNRLPIKQFEKSDPDLLTKHLLGQTSLLNNVRIFRNVTLGHNVDSTDYFSLGSWISVFIEYLKTFTEKWLEIASILPDYVDSNKLQQIESYRKQAISMKNDCVLAMASLSEGNTTGIITSIRFGENEYTVTDTDKSMKELLIQDMAHSWNNGQKYLLNVRFKEQLVDFIEKTDNNYDLIIRFDELYEKFLEASEKDLIYRDILYTLAPSLKGYWWKGYCYNESHFAALMLQPLIRHTNTYEHDQIAKNTFYKLKRSDRLPNFTEVCYHKWLSRYYKQLNNEKCLELAQNIENIIFDTDDADDFIKSYDDFIPNILQLNSLMRDQIAYISPFILKNEEKPRVIISIDDFKDYLISSFKAQKSLEDVLSVIEIWNQDINFIWWEEGVLNNG